MADTLLEMRGISKSFGGVHAVEDVDLSLSAGEVVGVLGHNGAGKSTLMKMLAGAYPLDHGEITINGRKCQIGSPAHAHELGIETIHQTLALADDLNATANLFLGRELGWTIWPFKVMDDQRMHDIASRVIGQLNPHFTNLNTNCRDLSGGQRQTIAIARAIQFKAKILIMDEPTAALGPQETAMVADLIMKLKSDGIGIFLISHDIHDVFDLADRVAVLKNGRLVGSAETKDVTKDQVLEMIIMGKCPQNATPGPGARVDEPGHAD